MIISFGGLWCLARKDWTAASGDLTAVAVAAHRSAEAITYCGHSPELSWFAAGANKGDFQGHQSWRFWGNQYGTPNGEAPPPVVIEQTQAPGAGLILCRYSLAGKVLKVEDGLLAGSTADTVTEKNTLFVDSLHTGLRVDPVAVSRVPGGMLGCRVELPYGPLKPIDIAYNFAVEPVGTDNPTPMVRDIAFGLEYAGTEEKDAMGKQKVVSLLAIDFDRRVTTRLTFRFVSQIALSNLCHFEPRPSYGSRKDEKRHNDVATAYELFSPILPLDARSVPFDPPPPTAVSGRPWCPPLFGTLA
jgi:hypothetical protein